MSKLNFRRYVCSQGFCSYKCTGDVLQIDDSGSNKWSLCGSETALPVFVSYTGIVNLKFVTDSVVGYTGFKLRYRVLRPVSTLSTEGHETSTTTFSATSTTAEGTSMPSTAAATIGTNGRFFTTSSNEVNFVKRSRPTSDF